MRNRETRLMHRVGRMAITGLMMVAAASAILPALAQPPMNAVGYDLAGERAPRFHEDQPEGWIRRNGIPRSDTAIATEHLVRQKNSNVACCELDTLLGQSGRQATTRPADDTDVHVLPVQGNVYMLVGGGGGNITLQAGDEGVLLVDTSVEQLSGNVLKAIRSVSTKPIRYIINTHVHADHVGGNAPIAKQGASIEGGNMGQPYRGAAILAHENVLNRMSAPTGQQAPFPGAAWPTVTYFTKKKELFFNGEAILILHQPSAHTDGDSIVFFRRSDVLSAGDLFGTTTYPVIDLERGGTIQGVIAALNNILDLAIPRDKQEGGTYVIPGHGRLSDEADVLEYRDMLTIIRDRIQDLVKKGSTLAQVKAARPTLDYDGRYGATAGPWTTATFIEAVYRNVQQIKGQ
jgi:cyclase